VPQFLGRIGWRAIAKELGVFEGTDFQLENLSCSMESVEAWPSYSSKQIDKVDAEHSLLDPPTTYRLQRFRRTGKYVSSIGLWMAHSGVLPKGR